MLYFSPSGLKVPDFSQGLVMEEIIWGGEYQPTGLSLKDGVILVDIGQESVAIELGLIKILWDAAYLPSLQLHKAAVSSMAEVSERAG